MPALTDADQARTVLHWTRKQGTSPNWWTNSLAMCGMNRRVSGVSERSSIASSIRLIQDVTEEPLARGISVGCGNGAKEIGLVRSGVVKTIVGYDLSPTRVDQATAGAAAAGISDRASFHVGDAFADRGPFDLVFWSGSLHHMPDTREAVRWSSEVLAPGGVFTISEYTGPTQFQLDEESLSRVNRLRATLPGRLFKTANGQIIPVEQTLETLSLACRKDPSEACDSAGILPAVQEFFLDAVIRNVGGLYYFIGLGSLYGGLDMTIEEDRALLESVLLMDEFCSPPLLAAAVAVKPGGPGRRKSKLVSTLTEADHAWIKANAARPASAAPAQPASSNVISATPPPATAPSPPPDLSVVAMRLLYVRNHLDLPAQVEVLAPTRDGERVIATIAVGANAVTYWKGKTAGSLNVRVGVGDTVATHRLTANTPMLPFELFIEAKSSESSAFTLLDRYERRIMIPGEVATVEELAGTDDLRADSRYVPGGIQVVRAASSHIVKAPERIICPDDLRAPLTGRFEQLFAEGPRQVPAFTVASIRNGRVLSPRYMSIFTLSDKMIKEQQNLRLMLRDPNYAARLEARDATRLRLTTPVMVKRLSHHVDKAVFVLGNGMGPIYGHWLLDIIPRLLALEKVSNVGDLYFLFAERASVLGMWREVIDLFRIDPDKVLFCDEIADGADALEFDELICPGFQHVEHWDGAMASSPVLIELYGRLRNRFDAGPANRRVYVSRRHANTRHMSNEEELVALLESKGFEIVVGENLSLEEKVRLYAETKVIAGLMGSNLINCVMMPPGGLVLEFFGNEYMLDAVRPVANVMGHRYAAIVGESVGDQPRRRKDIAAPVALLAKELDSLLG